MPYAPKTALAAAVAALLLLAPPRPGSCFPVRHRQASSPRSGIASGSTALAAGRGFGSPSSPSGGGKKRKQGGGPPAAVEKTYGASARAPIRDMIDAEAAMSDFFGTNEDWAPVFLSLAQSPSVPAMSFLGGSGDRGDRGGDSPESIEFADSDPWRRLDAIPTGEDNMSHVAAFLDSVQQSLIDIPVTDSKEEDENDLHFIEEGRRMLVLSRFHVLPGVRAGCIDSHRELFVTCWSELLHLRRDDEADTGSLIILPDHDLADVRRFVDMNLQRPLDWLGIADLFEVASLERDSPAIRLLHKLSDIPDDPRGEQ